MTQILTGWTRGTGESLQRTVPTGLLTPGNDPAAAARAGRALAYGTTGGMAPGLYNPAGSHDVPDFGDNETFAKTVPAALVGADHNTDIGVAPFDGVVTSVNYKPTTTITGAATNSRTVKLVNTSNGNAVVATYAFTAGNNATGGAQKAITLSSTPADRQVSEGDVLEWQSVHVGSGLADPGGTVTVQLTTNT
jgi:hypothetical protein